MALKTVRNRVKSAGQFIAAPEPKANAAHYRSAEHLAWREAVLRRAKFKCEYPGCNRVGGRLYADHIVELKDGGNPLDPANGQCLCGHHHNRKTAQVRKRRLST